MRTSTALTIGGVLLAVALGVALWSLATVMHPEVRIQGRWKEVACTYEKADPTPQGIGVGLAFGDELRQELTKGLMIHDSETWDFSPDALLVLQKAGAPDDSLRWALKGRGHILELVFNDRHQEVYQLRHLGDDAMVLQFNNDMIARGIVRIELQRLPD